MRIETIVKIEQRCIFGRHCLRGKFAVAHIGDVFALILNFTVDLFFDIGIARVHFVPDHLVDRQIDVIGREKPAAPKPVQIHAGGIFHRAEQVGGRRVFEHPALRIGFEREIEQFATHHGFAKNVQRGGRFTVGVVAKTEQRF